MEKPLTQQEHVNFGGMVSVADPHDIPAGQATLQVNVASSRPGELNARLGLKELSFVDEV